MLKTALTDLLDIRHPIIQAGMGPFSNNNLCVAASNAGVLGLLSTSGLFVKNEQPEIYQTFVESAEASLDDDMATVLEKVVKRTYRLTKDQGGVFGINVMVSAELENMSKIIIDAAIKVCEENPAIKDHFKENAGRGAGKRQDCAHSRRLGEWLVVGGGSYAAFLLPPRGGVRFRRS